MEEKEGMECNNIDEMSHLGFVVVWFSFMFNPCVCCSSYSWEIFRGFLSVIYTTPESRISFVRKQVNALNYVGIDFGESFYIEVEVRSCCHFSITCVGWLFEVSFRFFG